MSICIAHTFDLSIFKTYQMKKILIVDDTLQILEELRDILMMEGYEVTIATGAYLGIAQALVTKPDLIITDIIMPEMDGFGFISNIKTIDESRFTPIIVLSSKSGKEDIQRALFLCADIYLKKPCSADELIGSVDYLLRTA
jgi:DNA-binding response OmpR family regulator